MTVPTADTIRNQKPSLVVLYYLTRFDLPLSELMVALSFASPPASPSQFDNFSRLSELAVHETCLGLRVPMPVVVSCLENCRTPC